MGFIDLEGRFLEVNPAFEAALGFSPEEWRARSFLEGVHPNERSSCFNEIQKLQGENGSYRPVHWHWTRETDENFFYVTGSDLAELRKAENSLKESQEKFTGLFHSMAEGVVIHDKGVLLETN